MSTSQPLLFNPSRVSLEELEETFVGRWALLRQMETDLLDDAKKNINRHWLLIGPRGSGKSHLTELLARRLGRDHNWPVVRLPEEQYQVADLAQLLEQIVIRLEQLSTSPFSGRSSRDVQELALDRIRTFKTKRGTHIVVILENLTKFFQRKLNRQSEQKRLREILSRDAPFVLLTTATSFVEATLQESAPFYDFFHVLTLDDLSQEEVASLIEARAKWDREETLLSSPDLVRSRVEAVYHFSGGNPRLVLDLYSILRRGITDDLHQQLLKLLDEVTPYYQARLDDITPQMERVLSEMALAEQRLTPAEIGRRCRLPTNQVTANIKKLENERFVRPVGRPDGRRRYYEVRDRLLRLWMQMREEGNRSSRLRPLTEFFQHWYEGHTEEVWESAMRVGDAFWRDLEVEDGHRCREKLDTLGYLDDASFTESDHSFLVDAIKDARKPNSTIAIRDQIKLLKNQFNSTSPGQYRSALGYLIAVRLHHLGDYKQELQILDAVRPESIGGLRYALWDQSISALEWAHDTYEEAIAFGLKGIEQDPTLFNLRRRLIPIGIRSNRIAEVRRWLSEFFNVSKCHHCKWVCGCDAVAELIHMGLAKDARAVLNLVKKSDDNHPREIEALNRLIGNEGEIPSVDQWLAAIRLWTAIDSVPPWLLHLAICSMAHTPGMAAESFPLLVESHRRGPLTEHEVLHVAYALIDAVNRAHPDAQEITKWAAASVGTEKLQQMFIESLPYYCRMYPEQTSAVMEVYRRLKELGVMPVDLQPWATAVELEKDPDREKKSLALQPELKEAIDLLFAHTDKEKALHRSTD